MKIKNIKNNKKIIKNTRKLCNDFLKYKYELTKRNPINQIQSIKYAFISGEISYEKAKELATPIINSYNEKAKEIAKKYGKKAIKLSFAGLFR
jgi:lysophospholipase L1-like esterase